MAAGLPSAVNHRTMSVSSNRNGLGPSFSCAIVMIGYQKRRKSGCLVTSMILYEAYCVS
jgi:hypothetical protein